MTRPGVPLAVMFACAASVGVAAVALGGSGRLDIPTSIILGLVEGLTEFLPVSSTGHLAVTERLLDLRGDAADAYVIVVQAGAILAVVVLYRRRLRSMVAGVFRRDPVGRRLTAAVVLAFAPAALFGLLFRDVIKAHLFGLGPVAGAWAAGGVLMLVAARHLPSGGMMLECLGWRQAGLIGLAQAAAVWPGVSRSLVTILAGAAVGLALPAAVEFSFLLGFLTLGAASVFETVDQGGAIIRNFGLAAPTVGFVVAFAAAAASVRWMVAHLRDRSLAAFGGYRIVAAAAAVALLAAGRG